MRRRPKREMDGKAGSGSPERTRGRMVGETVYEDRPWPTPENIAALRQLLEPYLETEDRRDLQPDLEPERPA
jgi:hypothetical protein